MDLCQEKKNILLDKGLWPKHREFFLLVWTLLSPSDAPAVSIDVRVFWPYLIDLNKTQGSFLFANVNPKRLFMAKRVGDEPLSIHLWECFIFTDCVSLDKTLY